VNNLAKAVHTKLQTVHTEKISRKPKQKKKTVTKEQKFQLLIEKIKSNLGSMNQLIIWMTGKPISKLETIMGTKHLRKLRLYTII